MICLNKIPEEKRFGDIVITSNNAKYYDIAVLVKFRKDGKVEMDIYKSVYLADNVFVEQVLDYISKLDKCDKCLIVDLEEYVSEAVMHVYMDTRNMQPAVNKRCYGLNNDGRLTMYKIICLSLVTGIKLQDLDTKEIVSCSFDKFEEKFSYNKYTAIGYSELPFC